MNTRIVSGGDPRSLALAAALIRAGSVVAFPTETVYGLGAHAFDPSATSRIFAAKGRPMDNPLIVHVPEARLAFGLGRFSVLGRRLAEAFWPGPLTLVVPSGAATVALRVPDHPVAQALLVHSGRPIAAPSANRSGRPSPTRAEHVLADLGGRIPLIVDGGETGFGLESTVVDVCGEGPVILRPGGITAEAIEALGYQVMEGALGEGAPRAPGMKYRHYSPKVPVVLAEPGDVARCFRRLVGEGKTVGALLLTHRPEMGAATVFGGAEAMARGLYHSFRTLEGDVDVLLVELPPAAGIGVALRNRLRKAAGGADGII